MRVLSSDATSKIIVGTLLLDTASNGEAFSNLKYNGATPTRRFAPEELGFHPARFEDTYDYRMPAESFTFTRYAKTEVTSEYVQSKWGDIGSSQRLSYLDIISAAAPGSKGFDEKQDEKDSGEPEEPLAQAHRIQQAYREWCEVRNTSSAYLPRVELPKNSKFLTSFGSL